MSPFSFSEEKKQEVSLILNAFCGKKYGCTKREYTDVDGLINPREDQLVRYVLLRAIWQSITLMGENPVF